MLVELTTSRASLRGLWAAGDIIEVSPKEARKLIADGSAIPVRSKPVETMNGAPRRRGRPRKTEETR